MLIDDPYALAAAAATALGRQTGVDRHDVAVVLGSGWAPAAQLLGDVVAEVKVTDLPGFPPSTVAGHGGLVRSFLVGSKRVLVFLGRVHAYEGHSDAVVVHGVRTAVLAGCTTVVLTNASGGLRQGMEVGQPVLVKDHLNLTGRSPLAGPPPPDPHPVRFADLTDLWSPRLRQLVRSLDPTIKEGVYAGVAGPNYETPAEIRMLRTLGADLVGMSTVHEAIAAGHLGAEVLGMALVTNLAAGITGEKLDHGDVLTAAAASAQRMGALLAEVGRSAVGQNAPNSRSPASPRPGTM